MSDQLQMRRDGFEDLPPLRCPDGYYIRTYQPGDADHWARLMDTVFVDNRRTAADAHADVIDHPNFDPAGFCFVIHEGIPIGTACAWKVTIRGERVGYIDMLGVLPEHTGQKLGRSLTLFLLHYFRTQDVESVMLDTDDFRLPAIKNYINLGFAPVYADDLHRLRWQAIFEKLGISE